MTTSHDKNKNYKVKQNTDCDHAIYHNTSGKGNISATLHWTFLLFYTKHGMTLSFIWLTCLSLRRLHVANGGTPPPPREVHRWVSASGGCEPACICQIGNLFQWNMKQNEQIMTNYTSFRRQSGQVQVCNSFINNTTLWSMFWNDTIVWSMLFANFCSLWHHMFCPWF